MPFFQLALPIFEFALAIFQRQLSDLEAVHPRLDPLLACRQLHNVLTKSVVPVGDESDLASQPFGDHIEVMPRRDSFGSDRAINLRLEVVEPLVQFVIGHEFPPGETEHAECRAETTVISKAVERDAAYSAQGSHADVAGFAPRAVSRRGRRR
jgi:hypothetical protein